MLNNKVELTHGFDGTFMLGTNEQEGVTEPFFAYTFVLDHGHCGWKSIVLQVYAQSDMKIASIMV